ncbi:hypothetical protein UFOVP1326_41 [uncultured Caudovirales phage]|uniref:Uncharacterized protein n=1 Tax=uncultured Caudovirales phage TaxID=2100421 RepID=A0A6J5RY99_9CAUD|nr:hypothetical protein UFOVP1326_41 [uncultured Caudovirales phage]CAB4212977.1 hypothetical protein UFOVP1436_50 [uncultured Caudovirales phage]
MIHVTINEERRKAPRELAIEVKAQLHTMGERIDDLANIVYAAEWDGIAPYVTVLKGDISSIKMAYAGWPMVDEATWRAAQK